MKKLTLTALLALTIVAQPVYAETSTNPNVAHEVATESHHSEDKPEREQSSQEIRGFIGRVVRGVIDKVGDAIGRADKVADKAEKASDKAEKASNRADKAEKASNRAEKASDKAEKGNEFKEWTRDRIKNGATEGAEAYGAYESLKDKIKEYNQTQNSQQTNEDDTRCLQCSER